MNEEEILEKINWAIHVNEMTKSINGDNTHINVNVLQGLLDLYNKEKEKNKKLEDKIKEKIEWLEKNIIDNDYASENDKDVAENQIYILEWLI